MKRKRKSGSFLVGYGVFFLTAGAIAAVSVAVYAKFTDTFGSDSLLVVPVLLLVVAFCALCCDFVDLFRRKKTVDEPVNRILDATERIASGDFSVRLAISHSAKQYDEFDYIMENINKMAQYLSETEVLRSDFIANASHELKTPLAVMQSYALALSSRSLDEETKRQYVATIASSARRLTDLVENILKLNKLENQGIVAGFQSFRLDAAVEGAVLRIAEKCDEKDIRLSCELDEVSVYSQPDYLDIVWNNLLSNAVKFTDRGGAIAVTLKDEGEKVALSVRDSGCGISEEVGRHIFDKFYQGDPSHAQEGNGLGLALVKKVIDILGGQIVVESEVGKGTTFTVRLEKGVADGERAGT